MSATAVGRARPENPPTPQAHPQGPDPGREAADRFRRSGYFALRDVACDALGGVLHLRGRLPSYYLKQLAQALAFEVEGVHRVVNRIEVVAPGRPAPVGRDAGAGPPAGAN